LKPVIDKVEGNKYWLIAILFMVAELLVHLLTSTNYELHRDEMLYFNMADNPAAGYLTVPPVTGLLAYLVKNIFGYSVFGIRLFPALLSTATLYLIARIVRDLGGAITALVVSSVTYLVMPGYLLIFSLFTPNAIEIFLWSLIIYLIFRLTVTGNPRLWLWIGIVTGIAFNTKYSVVFPAFAFLISMLVFRRFKLIFSPWILAGLSIGILLIIPNIIWQYNHNWPVLFHMEELKKTQLSNLSYFHFFIDLFSLNSMFLLVWMIGLGYLLFSGEMKNIRFIGLATVLVFGLFILMKGKAYYAMGLIPFLIACGGRFIEKYIKQNYILIPAMIVVTLYGLISLPFVLPVLSFPGLEKYSEITGKWVSAPFMRWEDGKEHQVSQVYADMTGWKELAENVASVYHNLDSEDQKKCTIYCQRNYGYAGAIHFYGHPYHLPEPVTFLESYVFWAPDSIAGEPIIYIYYNSDEMQPHFKNIKETGTVDDPWFRESGLKVYLCTDLKTDVQEVYRKLAQNEKSKFQKIK